MIDRRMVTDFALALLIALPAVLPAAPSPWSLHTPVGYPAPQTLEISATSTDAMTSATAGTAKWDRAKPERPS